jgi:hypothetical protein
MPYLRCRPAPSLDFRAESEVGFRERGVMEEKSLFISSCTRRQLARRRSHRMLMRMQFLLTSAVFAAALGAFILAHGGL